MNLLAEANEPCSGAPIRVAMRKATSIAVKPGIGALRVRATPCSETREADVHEPDLLLAARPEGFRFSSTLGPPEFRLARCCIRTDLVAA